jgi:hypothetical protein
MMIITTADATQLTNVEGWISGLQDCRVSAPNKDPLIH